MENYLPLLQKSPLFASMEPQQITSVLHCVGAVVREGRRASHILRAGDRTQAMGLLLSGSAFAVQDDLWGQRNIMGKILPPGTFAEPFAATPGAVLNVSVVASVPSKVMFLNIQRITTVCSETCPQHALLIRNLVSVLARKNLQLNDKITHMSKRRTREKLLSYLSSESAPKTVWNLTFPSTASSWQTICALSVRQCPPSFRACRKTVFLPPSAAISRLIAPFSPDVSGS